MCWPVPPTYHLFFNGIFTQTAPIVGILRENPLDFSNPTTLLFEDIAMKYAWITAIALSLAIAGCSQESDTGQTDTGAPEQSMAEKAKAALATAKEKTKAAYEAAMGVSNRVLPEVQGLKSAIGSQKGDPFARMMSVMQSAQTMMQMFGMPSGMMPMGQPVPGPGGPQIQQPWEPPPVERRRAEEWEE